MFLSKVKLPFLSPSCLLSGAFIFTMAEGSCCHEPALTGACGLVQENLGFLGFIYIGSLLVLEKSGKRNWQLLPSHMGA